MRIAMPGEVDTYVCDRFGDGLLVWQSPREPRSPESSHESRTRSVPLSVTTLARRSASDRVAGRPSSSPSSSMLALTSHLPQRCFETRPRSLFKGHVFTDEAGHEHHYLLADQRVRIPYNAGRRRFSCRQVTRLDEKTGHETAIVTTRSDPDPALSLMRCSPRWRQENFFRYARQRSASTHSTLMRQNLTIPTGS